MSGTEATLPTVEVRGTRVTPRQRARTAASTAVEPDPLPPPPAPPGPRLDLPLGVVVQPRGGIAINGRRADHLLVEMDVTNNRFYTADSFSCTLALVEDDPAFGRAFWQDTDRIEVELFAGYGVDEPPTTSLLAGRVDEVGIDLDGRSVLLSGRDYTADLIETRISEKWPNKTSSEIARILAGMAGLDAEVTETSTLAGAYYRAEHAALADETTAWNLLTYLAEQEGYDALVRGRKVIFAPPPDPASASQWTVAYQVPGQDGAFPSAPATRLRLTRGLTIAKDITVRVVSWHAGRKRAVEGISRSTRRGRGAGGQFSAGITHVFRVPGLTQDQADALAKRRAEELTRNLRSFELETAALPGLDVRSVVTITGTGGTFDTQYNLDELRWRLSQTSGFTMGLVGRNVRPDDTAAL